LTTRAAPLIIPLSEIGAEEFMGHNREWVQVDASVRGILTAIYELEQQYRAQRITEIARGAKENSPLLDSRITYKRIHNFILRARQIERRWNKLCTNEDDYLNVIENTIVEDNNFPLSKEILYRIWRHSDSIQRGIEARRKVPYTPNLDTSSNETSGKMNWEEIKTFLPRSIETAVDWNAIIASMPQQQTNEENKTDESNKQRERSIDDVLESQESALDKRH
jgi:hypothetical protein